MSKNNKNVDEIKDSLSNIGKSSFSIVKSLVKITDEFLDEKSEKLKRKTADEVKSNYFSKTDNNSKSSLKNLKNAVWDNKANRLFDYRSFPLGLDSNNKVRVWLPDTSNLLITGSLGTGKTNLTKNLMAHVENNNEKWEAIYYNNLSKAELVSNDSNYNTIIIDKINVLEKIVEDLSKQERDESRKRILLIIDGIDELDLVEDKIKFFNNLQSIIDNKTTNNISVVLSSYSLDVNLVENLTLKRLVKSSSFSQAKFRQYSNDHNPILMNLPVGAVLFFDVRLDPSEGEIVSVFAQSRK